MALKIGINGFGRIGRTLVRGIFAGNYDIDVVAVNDLTDPKTLAHLFKYDSVHGVFNGTVSYDNDTLVLNTKKVKVFKIKDPAELPWKELGVDVVIESTGLFRDKASCGKHIKGGAKKVLISAPGKDPDLTVVLGVNDNSYDPAKHHIISNASCTTNCLAPLVKVLIDNFGFAQGMMTTIHSYTNDQRILDFPHKDLRRARAAALSMIPTTTGAAKAVSLVLPEVKGKLDGLAIRVPTPNVSLVDLVAELKNDTTIEEVNAAFKKASDTNLKGYLKYSDEDLVSTDFNGTSYSSIYDAKTTYLINKRMVKVLGWYDNEMGYAVRLLDLVKLLEKKWQ